MINPITFLIYAANRACQTGGKFEAVRKDYLFQVFDSSMDAPDYLPSGATKEIQPAYSAMTNIKR